MASTLRTRNGPQATVAPFRGRSVAMRSLLGSLAETLRPPGAGGAGEVLPLQRTRAAVGRPEGKSS